MAKKVKASNPSIMEQLAAYQPPWEGERKEEVKKDDKSDVTAGLVERLARAEASLEEYRKQQLLQSYQAPATVSQASQTVKKSTDVDMNGLPDPVTDPKVYTAELIKRINAANEARLENSRAEMAAQQSSAQLAQQVWEGFKKAQPDWAQHDLLVQAAANKVATDLHGRGVDVQRMMRTQPELFYGEVAGMLDKQYPQLKQKAGEEEEGKDDGEEANRTAGVFGGNTGRQAGPRDEVKEDTQGSMLREMAEMRYKAGVR